MKQPKPVQEDVSKSKKDSFMQEHKKLESLYTCEDRVYCEGRNNVRRNTNEFVSKNDQVKPHIYI